ncbi:hypothetical protein [Rhizobium sp. G21]|uniref:hypothetical protein n=1 Tax=Rhizobium sp. G21 TaxID=2758439 RepID=UPI0015FEECEC|nr:hypothetical protein [Rhizobium sp. G21]MBB1249208.1 hypothetical protein [Rhizobium sp. G21]
MSDNKQPSTLDPEFLQAVEEVTKERQLAGTMQDGARAMPPVQPQGSDPQSQEQPGFFQRLYNEVTAPKTAPVAGVDYGTAPDAGTMSAATRVLGSSVEAQSEIPRAVIGGAARAVLQTRDFMAGLTGETTDPADRTALRNAIEADYKDVTSRSIPNALAGGISQFVTGLIGAGKLMAPLKATQTFAAGGKAAQVGYEIARGAAAGAVVMDPHEARLSNMIQEFPALENPVSEYLAANPDDSAAEGRLKNALEGAGVDLAFAGAFALGSRPSSSLAVGTPKPPRRWSKRLPSLRWRRR